MSVSSPLGPDKLLLVGFEGAEDMSRLFSFQLDLLAENSAVKDIKFDSLLGNEMTVTMLMHDGKKRYFSGICRRLEQGNQDATFTVYRAEIVPQLWLTSRVTQSRIFQQLSVPDILKKVLKGLNVKWQIQGQYEKREYCVQYRESDFDFASRLMEEEGIFYFFKHTESGHEMVVADAAAAHPDVPGTKNVQWNVEEGKRREMHNVQEWVKRQEVRSGKFALWDHSFQRPDDNFESKQPAQDSIAVGKVTHKLKFAANEKLELYDYPGEFAQRFDGMDSGGGEQPAELAKISQDGSRTVKLRMQTETVAGLTIEGSSNCPQFTPGHKFTLERHFDAEGSYVLTSVQHTARCSNSYRSGDDEEFAYSNKFNCIPEALPFRPQRITPKPCVMGAQTAVVVGPQGEEIFTDKYGRVKVQFFWDREGKNDANSSCWLRVGTPWAGKQWGVIHIPRIGQEVIVDFMEGDPDAPIIIGSVYNANMMPPYTLPANKTQSGVISRSSMGGSSANFNQIRFEDKKGSEQVLIHAEKNQDIEVENDETHWVGHDRKKTIDHDETTHVKHDRTETVDNNETITIGGNRTETVVKNETITVAQNRSRTVAQNETVTVAMMRTHTVGINEAIAIGAAQEIVVGAIQSISVGASQTTSVGVDQSNTVGKNRESSVGKDDSLTVGKKLVINAGDEIQIVTGSASIIMKKDGTIKIKGKDIAIDGSGEINVKASKNVTMKGQKILQN